MECRAITLALRSSLRPGLFCTFSVRVVGDGLLGHCRLTILQRGMLLRCAMMDPSMAMECLRHCHQSRHHTNSWLHGDTTFTVCSSLLIAAECAYSRVYLQYHTPMQVCVGSIFGMVLGSIWYRIFETEGVRCMLIWLDGGLYELECCARRETMLCTGEESRKMNGAKDD